ncbi:MAG TPA: PAS domain-containing protein, partial [Bauldia sp.]|nr:PAS domain-containing protein [Bauldia sp.]
MPVVHKGSGSPVRRVPAVSAPFAAAVCAGIAYLVFAVAAVVLSDAAPEHRHGLPVVFAVLAALALTVPVAIAGFIDRLRHEKVFAQANEQRFRAVMDGAAIGMGLLDVSGRWIAAHRSLAGLLGIAETDLYRGHLRDIIHTEDRSAFEEAMGELAGGTADIVRAERRLLRADGTVVWALVATSAVRDKETGRALYFINQIEDITARKQAEAALAESESRWNFALEGAGHGVWDVNVGTGVAYHSPKWKAMLGYAEDEAGIDSVPFWLNLIHPDDRDRVLAIEDGFDAGRTDVFECEFRVRHRDGHYLWVYDQGRVVARDAEGRALRKIGTFTDITERRRQADAIVASENRWNFALESARQGVWDYDVATRTSYYSPMWKALLGYRDDEIGIDESGYWLTLVHPDDLPAVMEANERHLRGDTPYFECTFRMAHKDGRWIWILDRGKVIERDSAGNPVRMIGTHTDITPQKEAEQEIRRLSHRLQLAAAAGRIGLWEYEVDARRLWWDDGMYRLFGVPYRPGDPEAAYRSAVEPAAQKRIDDAVRSSIATGRPALADFGMTLPSGETRHIRMMADVVACAKAGQ